jgi:hypothetical protein
MDMVLGFAVGTLFQSVVCCLAILVHTATATDERRPR